MISVFFKTAAIFLIIAAGYFFRKRGIIDATFNRQLSLLQINLIYPCLIFSSITGNFTWERLVSNWTLPAGSAMIMIVGWVVGLVGLPLLRDEPRETRNMFHFQCAINNYSFLPIMLAATMLSSDGVAQIVYSALGPELVVWTIGVQTLTRGTRERPRGASGLLERLRSMLSLPLLAMVGSAGWLWLRHVAPGVIDSALGTGLGTDFSGMLSTALRMTGEATIPVSAIIVGSRIADIKVDHIFTRSIMLTTLLRLFLIPAIATALLLASPIPAEVRPALLIVAAQPASMASVMMGEAYRSDARFAAVTVLVTHVLCLFTIPVWLSAPWWG